MTKARGRQAGRARRAGDLRGVLRRGGGGFRGRPGADRTAEGAAGACRYGTGELAVVSMRSSGRICCLSLMKVEELAGTVRDILARSPASSPEGRTMSDVRTSVREHYARTARAGKAGCGCGGPVR